MKKLVLVFQKYGKFWSVSLCQFIKHKPIISNELMSVLILINSLLDLARTFIFKEDSKQNISLGFLSWLRPRPIYCILTSDPMKISISQSQMWTMQAKKSGFRLAAAVTWPPIHSSYCPSFLRIQNEYTINNVIFQNNKIATYSYILFRVYCWQYIVS